MTTTEGLYARLLPAETFEGWRVLPGGLSQPIDLGNVATLAEATQAALIACRHKDHFSVVQGKPIGPHIEHLFYVKQGKAHYVRKPGFAHAVLVKPLEAELRFSRAVRQFELVAPWRWEPGCDVVGHDAQVVEG